MRVVMRLCERVQVLDNGITLAEGSPNEIRTNERVRGLPRDGKRGRCSRSLT